MNNEYLNPYKTNVCNRCTNNLILLRKNIGKDGLIYDVICEECGFCTEQFETKEDAIDRWNALN